MTHSAFELENLKRPLATDDQRAPADTGKLSLLGELTTSAENSGLKVYNALAQVADACGAGLQTAQLKPQSQATVMSPRWWAQQGGSLAVTLPLILLTHKVVTFCSEPLAARAATAVSSDAAASAMAFGPDKIALARLTATGALYEGVFKPTTGGNLPLGRLKQAGEGGLGFFAMGLAAKKISGMVGGAAESELPNSLSSRLGRAMLPGLGGGAAYGFAHVQAQSILDNFRPAGFYASTNATARGALLGLGLSPLGMLQASDAVAATRESAPEPLAERADLGAKGPGQTVSNNVLEGLARDPDLSPADRASAIEQAGKDANVARGFARNGQHQQAVETYLNVVKGMARARGPEHPAMADVLGNLARSDMFLGNTPRSVESLQSALRINNAAYGNDSPQVAENYNQLSAVYQRSGDYAQAAQALDKMLSSQRGALASGKLEGPAADSFNAGLRDVLGRLATLYEKGGDASRAAAVRATIPAAEKPQPVPHQ